MRRWAVCVLALALASAALASETVTYTYDGSGRLVSSSRTGNVNNGNQAQYTLDKAGNFKRVKSVQGLIVRNDVYTTALNTQLNVDPRTNDVSGFGFPLTVTAVTAAAHGTSLLVSGTQVRYTPTTG